jgi:type II secretory pathway component PulM
VKQKNKEKLLVTSGIIAVVIIAYFAFFLFPALSSIKKQEKDLANNKANIAKVRKLLEEYKESGSAQKSALEGSLSAFIEQKSRQLGITIANIKPFGEKEEGVEVRADEVEGDKILKLLYELENNGITVNHLNIRDYKGSGMWVLKMELENR